mgnify:CR=1 FL=1
MISGEVVGHALTVSGQSAKSVEPGKAAFDHPTFRQENELLLSLHLGQLCHDQFDPSSSTLFTGFITGISLVRIRNPPRFACGWTIENEGSRMADTARSRQS